MKRILIRKPGGYPALELVEEKDPEPGPGQVRVQVRAAGVNFADCIVRMGHYAAAKGRYPITPGFEFSGVVDKAGEGDGRFRPGDRVLGVTRFGGYASSLVVDAGALWPCPEGWDFPESAAFPAVHLTAYYALYKVAKVEPGEALLVHSAAGGVGCAFLQLGRLLGCRTVAVVGSGKKAGLCRELGAEAVIDRSAGDLWEQARRRVPEGYDAIFDANGVTTPRPGFAQLAPGGRLVVYGFAEIFPKGGGAPGLAALAWNAFRVPKFSPLEMTGSNRSVAGFNVVYLFEKAGLLSQAMGALLGWVREGKLRKVPLAAYPLEKAAEAHRALESGKTTGKLVLIP